MIPIFSDSYLSVILSLASSVVVLLLLGLHFSYTQEVRPNVRRQRARPQTPDVNIRRPTQQRHGMIKDEDLAAIAGEDLLATQMDLARAYRESGQKQLAKKILQQVLQQGSHTQQEEARLELLQMQ